MTTSPDMQKTAEIDRSTVAYTEKLLELMNKRLQLLQALETFAQLQATAAENPDVTAMLKVLSRKQQVLDELEVVRIRLADYQHDDPERRLWRSAERRSACRQAAEEGNQLLRSLLAGDRATLNEVTRRRDAIAAQLRDGTDSVLASTAYTDGPLDSGELDIEDV